MKKPAKKKAPAVSPLPRKKKGKAGRAERSAQKPAPKAKEILPPFPWSEISAESRERIEKRLARQANLKNITDGPPDFDGLSCDTESAVSAILSLTLRPGKDGPAALLRAIRTEKERIKRTLAAGNSPDDRENLHRRFDDISALERQEFGISIKTSRPDAKALGFLSPTPTPAEIIERAIIRVSVAQPLQDLYGYGGNFFIEDGNFYPRALYPPRRGWATQIIPRFFGAVTREQVASS